MTSENEFPQQNVNLDLSLLILHMESSCKALNNQSCKNCSIEQRQYFIDLEISKGKR